MRFPVQKCHNLCGNPRRNIQTALDIQFFYMVFCPRDRGDGSIPEWEKLRAELPCTTQKKYWIGFNLVKGIGAARLRKLIQHFHSLDKAWQASAGQLRAAGLGPATIKSFLTIRQDVDLEVVCRKLVQDDIHLLTWDSPDYPELLAQIDQPPPVLYQSGRMTAADLWAVAIVGTRRVSSYGRQVAQELAAALAHNGVTVVSGLARGVDTIAHRAALQAGGRTLAVLGSGIDRIYPPENRQLAREIRLSGAVISDYGPGTPPYGINFPPRNRIISGLSQVAVIVEAGRKSGALITANFAADQGRDVFAVPGRIHAPQSQGTHWLLGQGAAVYTKPDDVLEQLDLTRAQADHEIRRNTPLEPKDPMERQLMAVIDHDPVHVDEISARAGLQPAEVSAALTLLELKGMVRQIGGMTYVRQ